MRQLMLAAVLAVPAAAFAADYEIDPVHSDVGFKIRHTFTKVPGRFRSFSGTFTYDPKDPSKWKASADIDPNTIDTGNAKRDGHLRSADFFDVEKCPKMGFKGTEATDVSGGRAKLRGELTMHCVTKPVVLDVEIADAGEDAAPKKLGLTATTRINRKDFGIVWNRALDTGGAVLGDDVDVTIELAGTRK